VRHDETHDANLRNDRSPGHMAGFAPIGASSASREAPRGDLRAAAHSPRLVGRPQSTLSSAIATPRETDLRTVCGHSADIRGAPCRAWTRRITLSADMVASDWRVIGDLAMPT
jgi:hypothetical protein